MILVDMKMPKNCNECTLTNECGLCLVDDSDCDYKAKNRPETCPIKTEITEKEILAGMLNGLFTKDELKECVNVFIENKGDEND